jgi:DNA modification methylase
MNIISQEIRPKWALYNADCVEVVASLPDNSVGYSVFSPPFASLYTYSDSPRDMGNSRTYEEFAGHFAYLAADLFRVTKQGRLVSFHCANIPLMKERDGVIGLRDFRGDMIRWFQAAGFIYHSEVTIWKDPVIEMQRTKSLGLLHKQIKKDSCRSRMGNPDYVVTMRKDGENFEPVSHTNETFPVDQWQKWASPVWMDIDQGNTLSYMQARDSNDERHICPLQLDVIERCIELWSNPGDIVLSPFAGIGSEGYVAVTRGRRFIGVELKPSYYEVAVKNLIAAEQETERISIFDLTGQA